MFVIAHMLYNVIVCGSVTTFLCRTYYLYVHIAGSQCTVHTFSQIHGLNIEQKRAGLMFIAVGGN